MSHTLQTGCLYPLAGGSLGACKTKSFLRLPYWLIASLNCYIDCIGCLSVCGEHDIDASLSCQRIR